MMSSIRVVVKCETSQGKLVCWHQLKNKLKKTRVNKKGSGLTQNEERSDAII